MMGVVDLIGQMIWNYNYHALLEKMIVLKIHLDECGGTDQHQPLLLNFLASQMADSVIRRKIELYH